MIFILENRFLYGSIVFHIKKRRNSAQEPDPETDAYIIAYVIAYIYIYIKTHLYLDLNRFLFLYLYLYNSLSRFISTLYFNRLIQ